jgi:hypothetical protein
MGALVVAVLVTAERPAAACGGHHYRRYDPAPTVDKDPSGRWAVRLSFTTKYYSFSGGNIRLNKVHLISRDEKLARWFHAEGKSVELWQAIQAAAATHTCKDVQGGAGMVKVERTIGQAMARFYRLKTKQTAAAPDVMIELEQPYQLVCNPPVASPTARRSR